MKKLFILIALIGVALPVYAENVCQRSDGSTCMLSCDDDRVLQVGITGTTGGATATFAAQDATTSITGSYASAVNLPDNTKTVIFDNQTNGDVQVSIDGGTTDHFHLTAGDTLVLPLAESGLETTGDVQIKDGTITSTSGTFYVYSYKQGVI